MIVDAAKYVPGENYYRNSEDEAKIMCVCMVKPRDNLHWRPCILVAYPDGKTDYVPLSGALDNIKRL